jgi:hypothetical protein
MIWYYHNFSKPNPKPSIYAHFEIFIFIQQWLTQKCGILGQFYVFKKTICKDFIQKFFHIKKWKRLKTKS